ncbi:MAG: Co2+/Mg2+ efflux protein ApaG [Proteobacteria bacterium]|nr:MAG: Co2+/Mg2+ efflux protein ApaG [Pseudomonadota bacterium]
MRSRRTNGVRVDVSVEYVQGKSTPALNQYLFAYEITISNENPEAVQLLHRHWTITDALGRVEEVKGPGVIGKQPRLKPGESFTYDSFCPLPTPFGSMRGTFKMMRDNGAIFEVEVPLFSLVQVETKGPGDGKGTADFLPPLT